MATGKAPYEGIYPPSTVVRAILHNKIQLSIEAQHFLQNKVHSLKLGVMIMITIGMGPCVQRYVYSTVCEVDLRETFQKL